MEVVWACRTAAAVSPAQCGSGAAGSLYAWYDQLTRSNSLTASPWASRSFRRALAASPLVSRARRVPLTTFISARPKRNALRPFSPSAGRVTLNQSVTQSTIGRSVIGTLDVPCGAKGDGLAQLSWTEQHHPRYWPVACRCEGRWAPASSNGHRPLEKWIEPL